MRVAAVVLALAMPSAATAAFGDVDTTFGDRGSAGIIGPSGAVNTAFGAQVVADAAGFGVIGAAGDGRRMVVADVRHDSAGALVPVDPVRFTALGLGSVSVSIAIPAQGGGTFVGLTRQTGFGTTVTLAKMRPDRTLDPNFGVAGIADLPARGGRGDIVGVDVIPDGSIVVTMAWEDVDDRSRGLLARLLPTGVLDQSFGTGGIVAVDLGSNNDEPRFTAAATDAASGTITVTADTQAQGLGTLSVFRFLSNGAPDPAFGGGDGRGDFFGGAGLFTFPSDIAIDSSGRAVIAATRFPGVGSQATVVRVTGAGALDATFDGDGLAFLAVPGSTDSRGTHLLVDTGTITVAGQATGFVAAPTSRSYIARRLASGAPDPAFGGGDGFADYLVEPSFPASMARVGANVVLAAQAAGGGHSWLGVTANGALSFSGANVVGGPVGRDVGIFVPRADGGVTGVSGLVFAARVDFASLQASGAPDPAFGAGTGASSLTLPATGNAFGAARTPGGGVVVVGDQDSVPVGGYVARTGADGAPEPAFGGGDGIVTVTPAAGTLRFRDVVVEPDGRVAVAGRGTAPTPSAVYRFRPDGSPEPAFGGGDGIVTVTPAAGTLRFRDVVVEPDGRVAVAGRGTGPTPNAVYRFLTDGGPDPAFGGGDGVAPLPGPATPELHAIQRTSTGGFVVVGSTATEAVIVRLLGDGTPDAAFGAGGVATILLAAGENVYAGAIDSRDRVFVTLGDGAASGEARVLRLTSAGTLDATFGTGGFVNVAPTRPGFRIRIQKAEMAADDSLVAGAIQFPLAGGMSNVVAVRVDPSAAVAARDALLIGSDAVAPLADGRLYVGDSGGRNSHAVRLLGPPPVTPTTGAPVVTEQTIRLDTTADASGFTGVSVVTESGRTTAYGSVTPAAGLSAVRGGQVVSQTVGGLSPGVEYHLRPVARNVSGTTAGADVVVRTARVAPVARITLPRRNLRTRVGGWRTIRGTAVDPAPSSGVARVEINLYRRVGRRCATFTRTGFRRIPCARAVNTWVRVPGRARWSRRITGLRPGIYTLRVRAIDNAGVRQTRFVTGRSRITLRLR